MRIVVGTESPLVIEAVRRGAGDVYEHVEAVGSPFDHSISLPLTTRDEMLDSATERAAWALKANEMAELGVGLENRTEAFGDKLLVSGLIVCIGRTSITGAGQTRGIEVPGTVAEQPQRGRDVIAALAAVCHQADVVAPLDDPVSRLTLSYLSTERFYREAAGAAMVGYIQQMSQ